MKGTAVLTIVLEVPVVLFSETIHADHAIRVDPYVLLAGVMAHLTTIMLFATRRNFPICDSPAGAAHVRHLTFGHSCDTVEVRHSLTEEFYANLPGGGLREFCEGIDK